VILEREREGIAKAKGDGKYKGARRLLVVRRTTLSGSLAKA
jgi:DNA invertase Pin-like site-specific DNA recombinase